MTAYINGVVWSYRKMTMRRWCWEEEGEGREDD
jgi:hypothetical protein